MRTLILLTIVLLFCTNGFPQKSVPPVDHQSWPHDIALIRPMINTNDSNGGYYSQYYTSAFNGIYCGAIIKNTGTASATHVYMEMQVMDYAGVLQNWHSDTIPVLNPGSSATVNVSGLISLQQWITTTTITKLIFEAKSDSLDQEPLNNSDTVPFTQLWFDMWSFASRSITKTNGYDMGQSGIYQSGDIVGMTLSIPAGQHFLYDMQVYIDEVWPASLVMTGRLFRNGHLVCSAPFNYYPAQSGWVMSGQFDLTEPYIYADSSYIAGIEFSWNTGTNVKIGVDTTNYHNFSAEAKARIGGTWTPLNFVPLIQIICDPEGIDEHHNPTHAVIYPNPASNELFLDNTRDAKIELYDLTGKLVLKDNSIAASRKIDISSLHSGIFILKIINKDNMECRKVVVNSKYP